MEERQYLSEAMTQLEALLGVDSNADRFIQDALACLRDGHWRGSVIFSWQVLIYFLYQKLSEFGLSEVAKLAREKRVTIAGRLSTIFDLNKIKDAQLVDVAHQLGFFDANLKRALQRYSELRNSCAHVSQLETSELDALQFAEAIAQNARLILEIAPQAALPHSVQQILGLDPSSLEDYTRRLSYDTLLAQLDAAFEELSLVTRFEHLESYENLFEFIKHSIPSRANDREKIGIFDYVYRQFFHGGLPYLPRSRMFGVFSAAFRSVVVLRFAIKKGYADSFVEWYTLSDSFDSAAERAEVLLVLSPGLTEDQIRRIAEAASENSQIGLSYGARRHLWRLFSAHSDAIPEKLRRRLGDHFGFG